MMGYHKDVERFMKRFYDSLFEKDRRAYAAIEAAKLGSKQACFECRKSLRREMLTRRIAILPSKYSIRYNRPSCRWVK
jgi:hypothetical protein